MKTQRKCPVKIFIEGIVDWGVYFTAGMAGPWTRCRAPQQGKEILESAMMCPFFVLAASFQKAKPCALERKHMHLFNVQRTDLETKYG